MQPLTAVCLLHTSAAAQMQVSWLAARTRLLLLLLLGTRHTLRARNVASEGRTSVSHSTCCVSGSPKNRRP
jgi:hypothetical protein